MNTLWTIWTKPTETLKYVLANKTFSYGFFIFFLASLGTGVMAFAGTGFWEGLPLLAIILISVSITYALAIPGWFINAAFYTWIGRMLGGTGKYKQMALITPVGTIPTIWMLPLNLLIIVLYGSDLFALPTENFGMTNMPLALYFFSNVLMLGLSIYATVIISKGIGLVHNFSAWRGFGTIMLLVLFVVILGIIISIIVGAGLFMLLN